MAVYSRSLLSEFNLIVTNFIYSKYFGGLWNKYVLLLSHNQYWYFYIKADIFLAITLGFILLATPLFIYIILPQTDLFVNSFFYINNKTGQNSFSFLCSCCPLTSDWFFETLCIFHNSYGNILFFLRTNSTVLLYSHSF